MNKKKAAALKAAAIAALVLFVGWPLFRAMTSTPGVVRISVDSRGVIPCLNSLGGPKFVKSDYFLSDISASVSSGKGPGGIGGVNNPLTGSITVYATAPTCAALAHEAVHVVGYGHNNKQGNIMHPPSVYDGTGTLTERQRKALFNLSGITIAGRVGAWILGPSRAVMTKAALPPQDDEDAEAEPEEEDNSPEAVKKRSPALWAAVDAGVNLFMLGIVLVAALAIYKIWRK